MTTIDSLVSDLQTYTSASSATLPSATCVDAVNETVRRMIRRHNWRSLETSVDLTIAAGTISTALPFDFLQEKAVWAKDTTAADPSLNLFYIQRTLKPSWFVGNPSSVTLDPIFPNVAAPTGQSTVTQTRYYFLWAGALWIVPTVSQPLTVQLDYVRMLPDLVAGLTVADTNPLLALYPDVVRWGGLVQAYEYLHEWDAAKDSEGIFQQRLDEAVKHDNAVAFAGLASSRGK